MPEAVNQSYDNAISVYQNYLPQIQAKYNNVLSRLENELATSQARQNQTFGAERTNLTNSIAKRGLTAVAGDQFFDTEHNALKSNQNIQSQDLLNKYAEYRQNTTDAQNKETMDVNAAIAGLLSEKEKARQAQQQWQREQELRERAQAQAEKEAKQQAKQLAKEYKLKKKTSKKEYELQLRELEEKLRDSAFNRRASSNSSSSALAAYINELNATMAGEGGFAPGKRELVRDAAIASGVDRDTAQRYMEKYLPVGWEWNTRNPNSLR